MASHRSPALGLSLIIVASPTHVVAAIPLKPTSRIFLIDPPFLTPNRKRLRRQDPKTIQRGIMPLAAEFRTTKPLSRKLSSTVGHVLPTKNAKRKHLLGREVRPKSITLALPDWHRQYVFVARLHEIGDDDATRFHWSDDFTLRPIRCSHDRSFVCHQSMQNGLRVLPDGLGEDQRRLLGILRKISIPHY